jgi:hypothetical protein
MHRPRKRRPRRTGEAGGAEQGPAIGFYHSAFLFLQFLLWFLTPDGFIHRTLPGCGP